MIRKVKKVNKWICKLCGEKQSQLKEFGRGSGAECRRHVQKLNAMRGAMMEEHNSCSLRKQVEAEREDVPEEDDQMKETGSSRWRKYLDTPEAEPEDEEEDNVSLDRQQLRDNHMTDRKRARIKGRPDGCTPEQANYASPPRKRLINPLSESPAPVSRWEESVSDDIISLPLTRSLLPVSSMFESGEDFSF
uniref:MRN complex-interacting protein isoform X2 n=1 Tax=Gasterosteus aculeatus aculeatus TaxID=481459 RepID=UPI001A99B831|nr:MRN complex-interacting protein isoform X2 [Gasterosteus aculeatus aculeatus]